MATEIARRPFRVRDICSSTEGGMRGRGKGEEEMEELRVEGRQEGRHRHRAVLFAAASKLAETN